MAYTLSFDASVKVQRGAVAGLLHHVGRDVDRQQGREVRHANQDIDASRTAGNMTMVADGNGNWRACRSLDEIGAALDARLADVGKPLRKDAVVLRPLVLQLDPEWYAAHQGEDEQQAAAWAMMDWASDTFGASNLVYIARHGDEASPHLHIGFCPVTDDGRLSQKDWFSSPAALRAMHKDFREYMAGRGYDIDMANRKPGKHAKRLGVQEYKDFRELERQRAELEAAEARIRAQEAAAAADRAQADRELQETRRARQEAQEAAAAAKADRDALDAARARIRAQEAAAAADRAQADRELQETRRARQEAQEAAAAAKADRDALDAARARVEALAASWTPSGLSAGFLAMPVGRAERTVGDYVKQWDCVYRRELRKEAERVATPEPTPKPRRILTGAKAARDEARQRDAQALLNGMDSSQGPSDPSLYRRG